jgi:hypothetical protein
VLSLAISRTLFTIDFWGSFYDDDVLPFLLQQDYLDILDLRMFPL